MRTLFLSRSMKTPPRTTAVISPARSSWTGRRICRIRSAATSSTRQFEKLVKARLSNDTVVLYGRQQQLVRAYAYWYFKLYGHDNVLLLDGGRKKWELDARELSSETVTRPATSYTATEPNLDIRRSETKWLHRNRHQEPGRRSQPDEYAGRLLAPAHLPQSVNRRPTFPVNVPWSKAANDDGTFRSDDELKVITAMRA